MIFISRCEDNNNNKQKLIKENQTHGKYSQPSFRK